MHRNASANQCPTLRPAFSARRRVDGRSRATVMFEILLILPFLMVIFMLLMYLGRGMVNAQKASVMTRYAVWHSADNASPRDPNQGAPWPNSLHGNQYMNDMFYNGRAERISVDYSGGFPDDAPAALRDEAATYSTPAGEFVDAVHQRFATGVRVRTATGFYHDPDSLLSQFEGRITRQHRRIRHDWKFANDWEIDDGQWKQDVHGTAVPWMMPLVRDAFLDSLDQPLATFESNGNPMGGYLRQQYLGRPDYRGPEVP